LEVEVAWRTWYHRSSQQS